MKTHRCPIENCQAVVPQHLLMCASHWHLLPKPLADAVYRTAKLPTLSEARFTAMKRAIDYVNGLGKAETR